MDISNVIEHMNSEEIKEFVNRGSSTETTATTETPDASASALTNEILENNTSTDADDNADDIADDNADDNDNIDNVADEEEYDD